MEFFFLFAGNYTLNRLFYTLYKSGHAVLAKGIFTTKLDVETCSY